jgi:hypothetical protein
MLAGNIRSIALTCLYLLEIFGILSLLGLNKTYVPWGMKVNRNPNRRSQFTRLHGRKRYKIDSHPRAKLA